MRGEYQGKVDLTIIPSEETAERGDELAAYQLVSRGHGLVAFTRSGDAVLTIAGHRFGSDEIRMAIGQVIEP